MSKPLVLDYPLRSNYMAQIVIPPDLTTEEALRLCAFIDALAEGTALAAKEQK